MFLNVDKNLKLYAYEENTSVCFNLSNEASGSYAPSMDEIYLYNHGSMNIVTNGVNPDHLLGWSNEREEVSFWMADTDKEGRGKDGIDAGEYLIIQISNIGPGDLVYALEMGKNGGLIFGLHIKGIGCLNDGSCSFIQTTGWGHPAPIPPTIILMGSGFLGHFFS